MRRALVGSDRLGSGCLVLRADTRENPGGKNGVMTKNGKICPSMQCQTNFSSFLKIEKFCPSVGQRMLRQSSGVLSPLSLCRAMMTRRELVYFSKFFKTLLKNFALVYHGLCLCDIPRSSLHFPIPELSQGFRAGS
jgi:hypothetical protein